MSKYRTAPRNPVLEVFRGCDEYMDMVDESIIAPQKINNSYLFKQGDKFVSIGYVKSIGEARPLTLEEARTRYRQGKMEPVHQALFCPPYYDCIYYPDRDRDDRECPDWCYDDGHPLGREYLDVLEEAGFIVDR